jgi:hypothetical protein
MRATLSAKIMTVVAIAVGATALAATPASARDDIASGCSDSWGVGLLFFMDTYYGTTPQRAQYWLDECDSSERAALGG